MLKEEGILVGRPGQGKHVYNWAVIPKNSQLDVLETELPTELYGDMYTVNSRRARKIMRSLTLVEYVRRDVPSVRAGYISYADVTGIKNKIPVTEVLSNPELVKSIDSMTEVITFEEDVDVDEKFILDLTNTLGTGAKLSRRFYSTQVMFEVESEKGKIGLMMPFQEMFVFLQDNPGLIKQLIVMPTYHFGILTLSDPIDEEIFKSDVLDAVTQSLTAFENMLNRISITQASTED